MRHLVPVVVLLVLGASGASAQDRGVLAIGVESARHAFSLSGEADAVNMCGTADCEVVATFSACLAVAHSRSTAQGEPVWTWTEASTEGDANRGAQDECEDAGGLACSVLNVVCLADAGSGNASAAPLAATAEQETVFWQSIVDSTNPAMFEAYLAQFSNGVFRALAEARLVELRAPAGPGAGRAASPASRLRASGDRDPTSPTAASEDSASRFAADETCTGKPEGAECWMEVANQPDCYVWNLGLQPGATVTWTAECSGGVAQGRGTLTWVWDGNEQTATGRIQDGERNGHWVVRQADGTVAEGPYVDGELNGHWVLRFANGQVDEGPFVDGAKHGHWVLRQADGEIQEGPYEDGKIHGHWVLRLADGNVREGPFVDGKSNGHWVFRLADGTVEEGPFVDGHENGTWVTRDADGTIVSEARYENGLRVRGLDQGPACTRQRLIGLGVLNSSIRPATIQFTGSRMVIVQSSGAASTRQESEYSVTADAITYRIIRATGTAPGSGSRDIPIINAGPHTVPCSVSGGVLSYGDGTWR